MQDAAQRRHQLRFQELGELSAGSGVGAGSSRMSGLGLWSEGSVGRGEGTGHM